MNLRELLQELDIKTAPEGHEHSTQGWINIDCPYCGREDHYRLGINEQWQSCSCWNCGPHKLTNALQLLTQKPYQVLRDLISNVDTVIFDRPEKIRGTLKIPNTVNAMHTAHLEYLYSRGFTNPKKLADLWGLKGIGIDPEWPWRIFIPIMLHGEIVSFTTRRIGDGEPRYINAKASEEAISAKDLLSGFDYVRHACIVVEGPFDRMRLGPGAVDTGGIAYSTQQVLRISKIPKRTICFDNSIEAQMRAEQLAKRLSVYPGETNILCLDAEDPGTASEKEVNLVRSIYL